MPYDKPTSPPDTWDTWFLAMADLVASKSKDRSTKTGVVIVGPDHTICAVGYNGFARGINDDIDARHARPAKYLWTEHAERNAIYNAARIGIALKGCVMYAPWAATCADCARAIIQAGISEYVVRDTAFTGKGDWSESITTGMAMLEEAGVKIRRVAQHALYQTA